MWPGPQPTYPFGPRHQHRERIVEEGQAASPRACPREGHCPRSGRKSPQASKRLGQLPASHTGQSLSVSGWLGQGWDWQGASHPDLGWRTLHGRKHSKHCTLKPEHLREALFPLHR